MGSHFGPKRRMSSAASDWSQSSAGIRWDSPMRTSTLTVPSTRGKNATEEKLWNSLSLSLIPQFSQQNGICINETANTQMPPPPPPHTHTLTTADTAITFPLPSLIFQAWSCRASWVKYSRRHPNPPQTTVDQNREGEKFWRWTKGKKISTWIKRFTTDLFLENDSWIIHV